MVVDDLLWSNVIQFVFFLLLLIYVEYIGSRVMLYCFIVFVYDIYFFKVF